MKRFFVLSFAAVTIVSCLSPAAFAGKPIQLSLWESAQIFSRETEITGLRVAIYGRNDVMKGVDFGIANRTDKVFKGLQYGIVGIAEGSVEGWQNNVVSIVEGEFKGFQGPAVYNGANDVEGIQWGFFNQADHCSGLEFGIVNYAHTMNGLQIGLLNIISGKEKWSWFPIVNWQFD